MEMDKYEQELFNFLTVRENFEAMIKINDNYNMIRNNLMFQFWDQVATLVQSKISSSQKWLFQKHPNIFLSNSKVYIYKKEWKGKGNEPFVKVAWEKMTAHPFFGVWCDARSKEFPTKQFIAAIEGYKNENQFRCDTDWWAIWKHAPYNFEIQSSVVQILPDERQVLAENYASMLVELAESTEGIIDETIKQVRS